MKIAWVTPLAKASAIGRIGVHVSEELARRGHKVTLVRAECIEDLAADPHDTSIAMTRWNTRPAAEIMRDHDLTFVNIGDNYRFHAGIFPFLKSGEAVGIFHDFYLYNLFRGWLEDRHRGDPAVHDQEIVATYGSEKREAARRAGSGVAHVAEIADQIPMTEWVAGQCAAAIAHSPFYVPRLAAACFGPVLVAPLPWQGRGIEPPSPGRTGRLVATTVGIANPNKCAREIVRAIGTSTKLRNGLSYVVAGAIDAEFEQALRALASEKGVDLTITGRLEDEALVERLSASDIICCLRKPVLEGASASAIEGLLTGRPVVVADAGFYADLPDDSVYKVGAIVPEEELAATFESLLDDEPERLTRGRRGKAWAERTFTLGAYADAIDRAAHEVARFGPVRGFARRVALQLEDLGLSDSDPLLQRIASTCDAMMPASLAASK